jgi:hypothetical protein
MLAGCEREPPDLPAGHVTWLDGSGAARFVLRARPRGYRVLAGGTGRWARIEREPGAVRLHGAGRETMLAQRAPEGLQLKDGAGQLRAVVRETPQGLALLDRAAAPLGRLVVDGGQVTVYSAGGLSLGTVTAASDSLVLRSRDGAIVGTVLGSRDPAAAALLLLEDLPLEGRLALLALRLPER